MQGQCILCGYQGEVNGTAKQPDLLICLGCFTRFYAENDVQQEDNQMGWEDVGGNENNDVLSIGVNTAKLVHILLPDNEEPFSYWTHYIGNNQGAKPKGMVVICPGKDTCPACARGTFRTKRVHAINVWDYENKAVKILEGGNSIFKVLKQTKDAIGTLSTTDISIKKTGQGKDTEYFTIPVPMQRAFDSSNLHGLFPIANLRTPHTPEQILEIMSKMGHSTVGAPPPMTPIEAPQAAPTPNTAAPTGPITLPFGKYKGMTMEQVNHEDPNYVKWCSENISDPNIKAEAKRVLQSGIAQDTKPPSVLSTSTEKAILANTVDEILREDPRYRGNFSLIMQKMKDATVTPVTPNGKSILSEFTLEELRKLEELLK